MSWLLLLLITRNRQFVMKSCNLVNNIFFLDLPNDNPMVVQLKNLASKVLFALSLNNFNAVFNRISVR